MIFLTQVVLVDFTAVAPSNCASISVFALRGLDINHIAALKVCYVPDYE